jgi:hypothetical protein
LAQALLTHAAAAVDAALPISASAAARSQAIDLTGRGTAACLGQDICGKALAPKGAIETAIGGCQLTTTAFASNNAADVIQQVNREAGRCMFQAFTSAIGPGVVDLAGLAKQLLAGFHV